MGGTCCLLVWVETDSFLLALCSLNEPFCFVTKHFSKTMSLPLERGRGAALTRPAHTQNAKRTCFFELKFKAAVYKG